jgi:hypothetical protein
MNARWTAGRASRQVVALVALGCVLVVAACGSSNTPSTAGLTGSSASTAGFKPTSSTLAFSTCMRANGVPDFPDINRGGMRIQSAQGPNGQTVSINGVSINAPAFQAARQKCRKFVLHADVSPAQAARGLQKALKFAECMRGHGVTKFPDPKITTGPGGGPKGS